MDKVSTGKNNEIYEFMCAHPCTALATKGKDDDINMAHVFTYVDDDMNLYFISRPEHRKIENIEDRSHVTFLYSDLDTVEQVEYSGEASQVKDADEVIDALARLQVVIAKHKAEYWVPPVSQLEGNGYVMIKVTPVKITYRKYETVGTDFKSDEFVAEL